LPGEKVKESARAKPERDGARTIGRVLKVLELMAGQTKPLRLVDVSKALDMPASSAYALLQQMVKYDYVQSVEDRRYAQSSGMVVLASRVLASTNFVSAGHPEIERLAEETGESIYLGIRTGAGIVYVDAIEARYGLVSRVPLGSLRPLHASSAGRVYLAFAVPEQSLDAILGEEPLAAFTAYTPVARATVRKLIADTRRSGQALNEQAMLDRVYGVSAPIFNAHRALAGTVTLSAPEVRFEPRREELISRVRLTAKAVSQSLGAGDWDEIIKSFSPT
jgi:DNA-binding IclR family transcriptional regulator